MNRLVLIKIGGSLITDKEKPFTAREDMLAVSAEGVLRAVKRFPESVFIVGNGAGSFGHYTASREKGRDRVSVIHESVVKLNSIFCEKLRVAGIQVVSIIPAEIIGAHAGIVVNTETVQIMSSLKKGNVVSVFGDIIPDGTDKGLILSTEAIFELLIEKLCDQFKNIRVILCGEVEGVIDRNRQVIPEISNATWQNMDSIIKATKGYDVTGGMQHKIESALMMARIAESVHIVSGKNSENIRLALCGAPVGTKIVA